MPFGLGGGHKGLHRIAAGIHTLNDNLSDVHERAADIEVFTNAWAHLQSAVARDQAPVAP